MSSHNNNPVYASQGGNVQEFGSNINFSSIDSIS